MSVRTKRLTEHMKLFFDGSKTDRIHGPEWLTLAGFMARDSVWGRIDREWESEVLQKRKPHAPYLHMKEITLGTGDFAGFTRERRTELVQDAVDYLQRIPKHAFRGFICTINTHDADRLTKKGIATPKLQEICTCCCVQEAFLWYFDEHPNAIELAEVYFDQNEEFMHSLRHPWEREKSKRRVVIKTSFWDLIRTVEALDMRRTPGLQIADMLAWATSRRHINHNPRWMGLLVEVLQSVLPVSRLTLDQKKFEEALGGMDS